LILVETDKILGLDSCKNYFAHLIVQVCKFVGRIFWEDFVGGVSVKGFFVGLFSVGVAGAVYTY
jgi:hypothetical protein